MLTVKIYCKPYVAHYFLIKFGAGKSFVEMPDGNGLKEAFHGVLTTKYYPSDHLNLKGYNAAIEVKVTDHEVTKFGHTIDTKNFYAFNKIAEWYIKTEMCSMICLYRQQGLSWKESIRQYQKAMGYTDEVFDWKTIERSYERWIKKIKNNSSINVGK